MTTNPSNPSGGEWLECCGCHRRYRTSDFRSDRLVCPACGRELAALVRIEEQDVEQVLKGYFFPGKRLFWEGFSILFSASVTIAGALYLHFGHDSRPVLVLVILFGVGMGGLLMSILQRWAVFRTFKSNRSNLEAAFARHREFMKAHEDWILDDEFGKNLERNLRARLSAAGSVRTSYATHGAEPVTATPAPTGGAPTGRPVARYRLPPDECPACHAPYRIADYSGRRVRCRKCGSVVEIENAVEDAEISQLTEDYRKRLVKKDAKSNWALFCVFCLSVLLTRYLWKRSDSTEAFLCGWSVLSLYFAVLVPVGNLMIGSTKRKRRKLLEKPDFRLFDLEYVVKTDPGLSEDYDERSEMDRFKGRLLALYKSRGAARGEAMKGKVLT